MVTHSYQHKLPRKIKWMWSSAIIKLTAHFMCGLMSDLVTCKHRKEYGYTWHWMSFLRPGVIKQHKLLVTVIAALLLHKFVNHVFLLQFGKQPTCQSVWHRTWMGHAGTFSTIGKAIKHIYLPYKFFVIWSLQRQAIEALQWLTACHCVSSAEGPRVIQDGGKYSQNKYINSR